jgi:hypothetical protein
VRGMYFDDERWTVRDLVVDTGGWLTGRHVLISPHAVEQTDRQQGKLVVSLTREQVRNAPSVDTDRPVSRQQEQAQYDYYGYPYYWSGPGLWGPIAYPLAYVPPGALSADRPAGAGQDPSAGGGRREDDPHLRSASEVTGYHIEASDGSIGHVEAFLFDDQDWRIRHAVVDTGNWLPGRKVLIDPDSIASVDWAQRQVRLNLTRERVESAPEYEAVA